MDSSLKNILSQVYELEGLLLLVSNHGKETNALVYELIREKSLRIAEMSAGLQPEDGSFPGVASCGAGLPVGGELPDKSHDGNACVDHAEFVQLGADINSDDDEECVGGDTAEEEADEVADDAENVSAIDFDPGFTPDFDPDFDVSQMPAEEFYDDEDEEVDFDRVEEITDEEDSAEEYSDEDSTAGDDAPEIKIGYDKEKPVQVLNDVFKTNGDFRKRLTLNDKFRFRRELFQNSETLFADALNVIDTMDSIAEAEDYFYNVLEWDRESEEVIDFMNLIKIHFEK